MNSPLPWYFQRPLPPGPRVGARAWGVGGPGDEWAQSDPKANTQYSNPDSKANTQYSNPDSKANTQYSNPDSKYSGPTATADSIKAAGEAFVQKVGGLYDVILQLVAANPGDGDLTKIGVAVQDLLGKAQTYVAQGSSTAPLETEYNAAKTKASVWKTTHTAASVPAVEAPPPPPVAAAPPPKAAAPPPPAAAPPREAAPPSSKSAVAVQTSSGLGKYMNAQTAAYAIGGVGVALLLAKMIKH